MISLRSSMRNSGDMTLVSVPSALPGNVPVPGGAEDEEPALTPLDVP